jgi:hypothetical protein
VLIAVQDVAGEATAIGPGQIGGVAEIFVGRRAVKTLEIGADDVGVDAAGLPWLSWRVWRDLKQNLAPNVLQKRLRTSMQSIYDGR